MSLMIFYSVVTGLTAVSFFATGLFIYLQNTRSPLYLRCFLFSSTVSLWAFGYFLTLIDVLNYSSALMSSRLSHAVAAFIPITYLHFVWTLLKRKKRKSRTVFFVIAYFLSLVVCATAFTPAIVKMLLPKMGIRYYPEWGILYPVFAAMFLVFPGYAEIELAREIRRVSGTEKIRLTYFFWALGLAFAGGISLFLLIFNIQFPPYLSVLIMLYPPMMAYTILVHQFMEIEVVIKRTLVFAGLAGSVVAVVSLMTFVSQDLLSRYVSIPRFWSNIFAAILIAAVYGRLRSWLVNITERYLFQKKYDYKELLKKFTDEVMVIIDLKQLVQMTVNTLSETVKLDSCSLLLLNKDARMYELVAVRGSNGQQLALDEQEPFITFLRETHEPISAQGKVSFPESVTKRLRDLKSQLCLPLHLHEDLIGVLCLGKKKSDEEFTKDDLDILLPLARTLAIAVSNAQLFDELAKTQAEAAQKEKLAVIGTLSAGINHEICNPLGIVKTQSEAFLLDLQDGLLKGQAPEAVLQRVESIMRGTLKQIDRATAITQKLSNFAKPIKEPTSQPVSVSNEVDEVLALVSHDLKLERIDVIKEIAADLPNIVVDRRQLQEVLFNLIRNAGQAINSPGRITVRARTQGQTVRIEIEDTGLGIPADKLSKIYDPFYTTKEPGKGTGLGLFIVRQIVERNKGRITVESTVGKGTTFFLDFPVAKSELAGRQA